MIYVGIDDTDIKGSPGTNFLARRIVQQLAPQYRTLVAIRHQLLFDPRIPYTSKNSSASLLFELDAGQPASELAARIRDVMRESFIEGSDPGLCVAERVPAEVTQFGRHCQREVVDQQTARHIAARHAIYLEGLGGSEDGVIGALAAAGLAASGDDGRVVQIAHWPDELAGPQNVEFLHARGVDEVVRADSGGSVRRGVVDIGKHLRPNYRRRRVVLFVEPARAGSPPGVAWQAVRRS